MYPFASHYQKIKTIDMHTGGEPLRIVLEGFPSFEGQSILEIRRLLQEQYDHLRKAIMWEPRGHADMYGLLKVPAQREDSDFGVIFMHNAGYSTMCGHATIAIAKAAVMMDWVKATPPTTTIKIDAPCGQLTAYVHHRDDDIDHVSFENVPSFLVGHYQTSWPEIGTITYDLAYGGAFYAYLDVKPFNLTCTPKHYNELVQLGRALKRHIKATNPDIRHPYEPDLSFLYGTIFIDEALDSIHHSRNVCVFADGEVDRCSTGSGVSGRAAIHYAEGSLPIHTKITIESIIGTTLEVCIKEVSKYGGFQGVVPEVFGNAYFTGIHEFWVDDRDPLRNGFLLH